jgi:hypothetical protein
MSSFYCEKCGAPCIDTERGYVSGCEHYPPDVAPAEPAMTRREAEALANRYIPNVWGTLRTAWVNGFIGYPEMGVAKYPGCSEAARFRRRGVRDRKQHDKQNKDSPDE